MASRRWRSHPRGSALVEFALVWPVLLLLAFGSLQLSIWASVVEVSRYAAGAGARAGSIAGGGAQVAEAAAFGVLHQVGLGVRVASGCGAAPAGGVTVCATVVASLVTVRVEGEVPLLLPLPGGGLPVAIQASAPVET